MVPNFVPPDKMVKGKKFDGGGARVRSRRRTLNLRFLQVIRNPKTTLQSKLDRQISASRKKSSGRGSYYMDMEWSSSRCEDNQDSMFKSSSPDAVYKEDKIDDFEFGLSMAIDTYDKEKSSDSRKHRSKGCVIIRPSREFSTPLSPLPSRKINELCMLLVSRGLDPHSHRLLSGDGGTDS
ncbi:hypothetical protein CKAN_00435800 [Cinnamomum micranthum f. kanehirae]|uniref:Uncharacterized protein n=1 Tax=Cinnamomum micranthum f. kanehirae TaxID=337451 RepID=A0A3S3MA38_9MAGN|nr:hypothetical protein CKAN_00435800 [Cinnamomum micranthum f. kanehirae]